MTKISLFLISLFTILSFAVYAQGWIGNSNSLIAHNSLLNLTPLRVGIGVNSPTSLFHTNGTLRFEGLSQATGSTFNRLIISDNNGNIRWFGLNSLNQGDSDWFGLGSSIPPTNISQGIYTEGRVLVLDSPIGNNTPRSNFHVLYTNNTAYNPANLPIANIDPNGGGGLLIENQSNARNARASVTFMTRDPANNFEATSVISSISTGLNRADLVFQNEAGLQGSAQMIESLRITSSGDVYLPNTNRGVILTDPSGGCWRLTINTAGNLTTNSITCP